MIGYFQGWRRNVGIVTLLIALVFAAGWVRSLSVEDSLAFPISESGSVWLLSVNGLVGFRIEPYSGYFWYTSPLTHHRIDTEGYVVTRSGVRLGGRCKIDSDGFDPNPQNPVQREGIPRLLPLWSFVITLLLVSSHLLFSTHLLLIHLERKLARAIYDCFARYRRAVGVATLLLALLLTGWWGRSLVVHDCIYFADFINSEFAKLLVYPHVNRRIVGVATDDHSLVWLTYGRRDELTPTPYPSVDFPSHAKKSDEVSPTRSDNDSSTGELPSLSTKALPVLSTAPVPIKVAVVPLFSMPFWCITTPLIFVSAFLLLIEPRKISTKNVTEPVSTEET